jgi:hypothetical protein
MAGRGGVTSSCLARRGAPAAAPPPAAAARSRSRVSVKANHNNNTHLAAAVAGAHRDLHKRRHRAALRHRRQVADEGVDEGDGPAHRDAREHAQDAELPERLDLHAGGWAAARGGGGWARGRAGRPKRVALRWLVHAQRAGGAGGGQGARPHPVGAQAGAVPDDDNRKQQVDAAGGAGIGQGGARVSGRKGGAARCRKTARRRAQAAARSRTGSSCL